MIFESESEEVEVWKHSDGLQLKVYDQEMDCSVSMLNQSDVERLYVQLGAWLLEKAGSREELLDGGQSRLSIKHTIIMKPEALAQLIVQMTQALVVTLAEEEEEE